MKIDINNNEIYSVNFAIAYYFELSLGCHYS